MTGNLLHQCIHPSHWHNQDAHRATFQHNKPFKHLQIDSFFQPDFLQGLLQEFPSFEQGNYLNENGEPGGKSTLEKIQELGPHFRKLDALIQSPEFRQWLSETIGSVDLLYDLWYFVGGTHENRNGQDLDPHVDFNRHPETGWHRRVNLIIYLNETWDASWGGTIDLHKDPYLPPEQDEIVRILPLMNRAVMFETTDWSWHGFTRIQLPEGAPVQSRKSIALYFYSKVRPAEELGPTHSTIYVDRHLPQHIGAGHTLTEEEVEQVRILLARRDGHIKRLYRDITRLTGEVEALRARLQQQDPLPVRMARRFRRWMKP